MQERVFVIGAGPSLEGFDFNLLKDEDTIVVNKSLEVVPCPNYFITMDYLALAKISLERFFTVDCEKIFVANFDESNLSELDGSIVDTRMNLKYDLRGFSKVIKSYHSDGIGLSVEDFHSGGHSGFCAVQYAYLLGYKEIYLLGFDYGFNDNVHFGSDSCDEHKKELLLTNYQKHYESFCKGVFELDKIDKSVSLYVCSDKSKLTNVLECRNPLKLLDKLGV